MYDGRAVANFFIDRSIGSARPITAMTLLKVLYFAHAWYLARTSQRLIAQPFEAWQYGPVNRVVYDQVKGMGSKPITGRLKSFDLGSCTFVESAYSFDQELSKFLENVFDYYSHFHPFKLSDLTHEEGSPWDQVWREAEDRAVPGMIIPDELIMKWFREDGGKNKQ